MKIIKRDLGSEVEETETKAKDDIKIIPAKLPSDHKYIEILPTGDWHFEDPLCLEKEIDAFIEYVLDKPYRYVIIDGDIFNAAIMGSKSDVYGNRMSIEEAKKTVKKKLGKIAHRILAITPGNHEGRITKSVGIDILGDLAENIGLGNKYAQEGYILVVEYKKKIFTIYNTHGSGGGATTGAKANKLLKCKEIICNADMYIIGHIHEVIAFPKMSYFYDTHDMALKKIEHLFVSHNGFLKFGGYGHELGYSPTCTNFPHIRLNVENERKYINCNIGITND